VASCKCVHVCVISSVYVCKCVYVCAYIYVCMCVHVCVKFAAQNWPRDATYQMLSARFHEVRLKPLFSSLSFTRNKLQYFVTLEQLRDLTTSTAGSFHTQHITHIAPFLLPL